MTDPSFDENPPGAMEFGIDTRDEIDLGQCEICSCLVAKDAELDHLEWHRNQERVQVHVDISLRELWDNVRKHDFASQEELREAIGTAIMESKLALTRAIQESL